jgi:hypothetical protein
VQHLAALTLEAFEYGLTRSDSESYCLGKYVFAGACWTDDSAWSAGPNVEPMHKHLGHGQLS